jgi:hypothetical protein
MSALRFPLHIDQVGDNLQGLRHSIERSVPTGREGNRQVSDRVARTFDGLGLPPSIPQANKRVRHALAQLGSLGGGNHFIEICTDTAQQVWLLLHSGSRHIGKELADTATKVKNPEFSKFGLSRLKTRAEAVDPGTANILSERFPLVSFRDPLSPEFTKTVFEASNVIQRFRKLSVVQANEFAKEPAVAENLAIVREHLNAAVVNSATTSVKDFSIVRDWLLDRLSSSQSLTDCTLDSSGTQRTQRAGWRETLLKINSPTS